MDNIGSSGEKIYKGLFWTYAERFSAQIVSVIVTIIIARILLPEQYGIIAIVTVLINICDALVTGGIGNALIQKKECLKIDYDSIFLLNFILSIVLYFILFFLAPFFEKIYMFESLTIIIRIMGVKIIIASLNSVQHAYVQKKMAFRKFFYSTFVGTLISAIVGIILAYNGFGVWALVAQYLTNSVIDTIMLYFFSGWKPGIKYSSTRVKEMLPYGFKYLFASIISVSEESARSLIIGKVYNSSELAYYDQGKKYPSLIVGTINTCIAKVLLPALSNIQNDIEAVKEITRKFIRISSYILCPMMLGFVCLSKCFISVVLTDKWLPAVEYINVFCLAYLTRAITTTCQQSLLSQGRSDINLLMEIINKSISISMTLVAIFVFDNPFYVAVSFLIAEISSLIIFSIASSKVLKYHVSQQILDFFPSFLASFIMGLVVYFFLKFVPYSWYSLLCSILIGVVVYFLESWLFKINAFIYLKGKFLIIINRRKNK